MDSRKSDFSIYCAPVVEGGNRRNVDSTTVRVPFRGELITWADNHAKAAEALRQQALQLAAVGGHTPSDDLSRILDRFRLESYAVGALHADLAAGRFR